MFVILNQHTKFVTAAVKPDFFYGRKYIASLYTRFITHLFAITYAQKTNSGRMMGHA
jgi:hypothetical protein